MIVLAFDIAKQTGWCCGTVGRKVPDFGSIRFAKQGASHGAIASAANTWFSDMLARRKPDRIIYEEPLHFRGFASGKGNAELAYGLAFILQRVAFDTDFFDVRNAQTRDVRNFFLGSNPRRAVAKKATIHRCKLLGWNVPDDDAADACALWMYACSFVDPKIAMRPTPLFSGHASLAEEITNNGD